MNFDVQWTPGSATHLEGHSLENAQRLQSRRVRIDPLWIPSPKSIRAEYRRSGAARRGEVGRRGDDSVQDSTARVHGHAILSGSLTADPYEYVNTSGHVGDSSSIMNIRRDIRKHFISPR